MDNVLHSVTASGYREILFRPRPGGGLDSASARHDTPYGRAAISWTMDGATLTARLTVPAGCRAVVDLPGRPPFPVGPGEHTVSSQVPP